MNKLDVLGSKSIFGSPTEKLFTNAIVDAIDVVKTSTDIYPYVRSATTPTTYNVVNFRSTATDIDLALSMKFSFGVPIANDSTLDNQLYHIRGSFSANNTGLTAGLKVTFFFGRIAGTTIVQDDANPANQMSEYITLMPPNFNTVGLWSTGVGFHVGGAIDEQVLVDNSSGSSKPLIFGVTIENSGAAAAAAFRDLLCTLQIRSNVTALSTFRPSGI